MSGLKPITTSELRHCERFCFNGGECIGCLRDPHGMAQCVGCICPQHLWTGERCEIRVGYLGLRSREDNLYILTITFATFTVILALMTIFCFFKGHRFRKDPLLHSSDQPIHLTIQQEASDNGPNSQYGRFVDNPQVYSGPARI